MLLIELWGVNIIAFIGNSATIKNRLTLRTEIKDTTLTLRTEIKDTTLTN